MTLCLRDWYTSIIARTKFVLLAFAVTRLLVQCGKNMRTESHFRVDEKGFIE